MNVKPLRVRQAEATRQLLVTVARELFTERGYAGTSIDDIIQRAGAARGALYHHFDGKEAVFRAVYDEVQAETLAAVVSAALAVGEPWAAVRAGLAAFLDACLQPTFRQVVVLDSVSLLQHRVWAGDDDPAELPMLRQVLVPLVAAGTFPDVAVDALVHVTLGGLYGAALYIARSADHAAARTDAEIVIDTLVGGLRAHLGVPPWPGAEPTADG